MDEVQPRITDFKRLCRLCLHETNILMDIFDSSEDNRNLEIYQKIKACATIDLCKDDGLPTRICAPCLSSLNAAFEFKIQCENADKTLHEIYHLLASDEVIFKGKEKKIILMKNDMEPSEGEDKKLMPKQFIGLNHILVVNGENEVIEEKNIIFEDNCDCDKEDTKEENTIIEDAVYVLNPYTNNKEPSDSIAVEEIMSINEEGIQLSGAISSNAEEVIKSNESSTPAFVEEKEKTNVICLEVERKTNNVIPEAKRSACPFCHKMLTRVNEHIRLLHRNKVYVCKKKDCGAEFLTLKNLQSHQLKCFNMEKPYKCLRCFKEFYRKCNYKAHIVRHSNKKAFQCQLCDKAFVDSTGLRRHFLKHHEPQQETFTSGCCGKTFKTKEGLKQHIQKGICGVQIFPVSVNKIIKN